MDVYWYETVHVVNDSIPLVDAKVQAFDKDMSLVANGTTDNSGNITFKIREYTQKSGTKSDANPHKLKASKSGYPDGSIESNIKESKTETITLGNEAYIPEPPMTINGDWIINDTQSYFDKKIFLNGNLIIQKKGDLKLDNVTLSIKLLSANQYKIEVQSGGRFNLLNSSVNPAYFNLGYYYDFNVYGYLDMENTLLRRANSINFYDSSDDNSTISASTIEYNANYGINIQSSSPSIKSNTIAHNGNSGIYSSSGKPVISDNIITDHSYGISTYYQSITVYNTTIQSSSYDYYIYSGGGINSVNTTFDRSKVYFYDSSRVLNVSWYLNVKALDANSNPISNANVTVNDSYGTLSFKGSTDAEGLARNIIAKEYRQTSSGKTYYTPHDIFVEFNNTSNHTTSNSDSTKEVTVSLAINQPLKVTILSPANNSLFVQGEAVTLSALGFDPVDGILKGSAINWTSDIDGLIGSGEVFSTSSLSVGNHKITAEATNSNSDSVNDSVDLQVIPRSDLIIENVNWKPVKINEGELVTFNATVKNIGGGYTPSAFYVRFYIDTNYIGQSRIERLNGSESKIINQTWIATAYAENVVVVADYYNTIKETDEENNRLTVSLTDVEQADLIVSNLTWSPEIFHDGTLVAFKAEVQNIGVGNASKSFDTGFYIDGSKINSTSVTSLASGKSVNFSASWTASPGSHVITVKVDDTNKITESNESNNSRTAILPPVYQADLIISNITIPSTINDGDIVFLNATVENVGQNNTQNWFGVRFFIDGNDIGNTVINGLSANNSTTIQKSWTATTGNHTLIVTADAPGWYGNPYNANGPRIIESNETNNNLTQLLPEVYQADLTVSTLSWTPSNFTDGEPVTFTAGIENIGAGNTTRDIRTTFFIDNISIGYKSISGLASGSSATITQTWSATPGEHKIKAMVDSNLLVAESNENNNTMELNLTRVDLADLVVSSLSWTPSNFSDGGVVTFTAAINNTGIGNTTRGFYTRFFIDGVSIGDQYLSGIASGSSRNVIQTWTATPGEHIIKAEVDIQKQVIESDEINNSLEFNLNKIDQADLIVSNLEWTPSTFIDGQSVKFNVTIENIGIGNTTRGFYTRFLIDNASIGDKYTSGLASGTSANVALTWTAAPGEHKIKAIVDVNNNVAESNELNNSLEFSLTKVDQADLIVSSLTWTPSDFTEGQVVTFNAVIENAGYGNTTRGFYTRFLIDENYIGDRYFSGLSSGSSTLLSQTWVATPGNHTIKAVADANNHVSESDETNNSLSKNISYIQAEYLLSTGIKESYAEDETGTFSSFASRKSSPAVYLSDSDVSLNLTLVDQSGNTLLTGPMSYFYQFFFKDVNLTGYSKGSYTALVKLEDSNGVVVEKSVPFKIVQNFSVSLSTDKTIYDRDEIVQITGHAQYPDESPVPNTPVILSINGGYTHTYSLVTGSDGSFYYYFNPSYSEAGNFSIGASVISEKLWRSGETSFKMYGLYMTPSGTIDYTMSKNSSEELTFTLKNFGDSVLHGVTVDIVDENTGDGVDYQIVQTPALTLAPNAQQYIKLKITAGNIETSKANFSISVTTDEGSHEEALLKVHLVEAVPIAFVNPTYITAGMNPENIQVRTVNVSNFGYESMKNVNISKPNLDWISTTSSGLGSITPYESKSFDIILHPSNDTAPGVYQDNITISSSNHKSVRVYLTISVTSSQQGDLLFHVVNDIGENISGASITIQNQDVFTEVFKGTTNQTGYYLFDNLSTGRYTYIVKASGHDSMSNSVTISPEIQTLVEPVLQKKILGVQLTVTPITIADDYNIQLNLTFETEVPPPVLMPSPLYISYGVNFTDPEYENDKTITISNPGLISIFNVSVDSSLLAGVNISFPTGRTFFIDEIKAKSSVTIPYHLNVTSVSCSEDSRRNNIRIRGDYIYFEENSDVTHNVYLSSEIPVFISMYNCPVSSGPTAVQQIEQHFRYSYHPPGGSYSPGTTSPTQIQYVETVRERVKLSISQQATLERDAFGASLELTNKLADKSIENVKASLEIKDKEGSDASGMFFVNQTFLDNINSIDGSGVIDASSIATADWLLIPTPGAGGTTPVGKDYTVQAFIDYSVDGVPFSVNSTEESINVMPQPLLNLTYLIPGEVKADTPFNLTLNITNVGYGVARNLKLDSAQPMIYENKAGLLVSFKLIGSGIVGGTEGDSMLINFGDIAPGQSKEAYWIMTASLDGEFTEFKGSFSHSNALGGAETSLIKNITYVVTQFTAEIISPEDGEIYYDFEPIHFEGTAHNGTEPLIYDWNSFIGGYLDSNQSFNKKLRTGLHAITLKVTDKNGIKDTDTHTIKVKGDTIEISVGAKYVQTSKNLDIYAYAFDKFEGEIVTSGAAKYEILNLDGNTTGLNGELLFNSNSKEWEVNNVNLAGLDDDEYYVKVIIKAPTGYGIGQTQSPFVKLDGNASLFGYLIDGTNSTSENKVIIPNEEVSLYVSNDFYKSDAQPIANSTTDLTGKYTFDQQTSGEPLTPAYYVLVTETNNRKFVSKAFKVGSENFKFDTYIYEKLAIFNPRMESLRDNHISVMDYETRLMAEISGRFHEDMEFNSDWIDKSLILVELVVDMQKWYPIQGVYGAPMGSEYYDIVLKKHVFEGIFKELAINLPSMFNSVLSENLPTIVLGLESGQTENDLKNTNFYGTVYTLLIDEYSSFAKTSKVADIHNEFDINDANKVIEQQNELFEEISKGYSIVMVPLNPDESTTLFSMRDSYGGYKEAVVAKEKFSLFAKSVKVFIIVGKISTLGSPIGAVIMQVSDPIITTLIASKEIVMEQKIGEMGALTYASWVQDLSKIPHSYETTSDFLIQEASNPYYLSKSNDFSADLTYEGDIIKEGTTPEKPFEIKTNWLKDPINGDITLHIKNTGNVKSTYRAYSEVFLERTAYFSNSRYFRPIGEDIPMTVSFEDNSIELKPSQQESMTLKYKGFYFFWNNYDSHRLILRVFSGPFEIGNELVFFRVVDPENGFVNSRTSDGILTEDEDSFYLPSISKIISDNLTSNNPFISKTFTTQQNTSSLELDMISSFGTPVDLHVYDEKGRHVGYNIITDTEDTEFPAIYRGRFQNPEQIIIPNAANKTFTVQVSLTYSNYPTTTQVTVHALETPKRPAILTVSTTDIIEHTRHNRTLPINLFVAESGGQHPIHDVNATISNITMNGIELPLLSSQKIEIGDLPAGSIGNSTFVLNIPSDVSDGSYTGIINVDSEIGSYPVNVNIYVSSKPDLMISYVDINRTIRSGEDVNITVIAGNQGFTNVTNTKLELFVDNISIDSRAIDIPSETSMVFIFNWTATTGNHIIKAMIDSDNTTDEFEENNNEIETSITVNSISDLTPPIITFVSPTDPSGTVLSTRSWTFINVSLSEPSLSWLEWNGTNESMSGSESNWSINKTDLANGVYTYRVWANDSAGNLNVSETRTVEINYITDTTPPIITIVSPVNNSTYMTDSVDLNYSINELTVWQGYSLDGADNITLNGNTTLTGLVDSVHTLIVYANDTSGNMNSSTVSFTIDNMAPEINSITLNNSTPNTNDVILVTVNATDNIGVTGVVANGASLTNQGGNIWNGTIIALAGTHSVNVSASDAASNTGWNNSTSYTATIPPIPDATPPVIMNVSAVPANDSAVITWDTDEASDSLVKYGASPGTQLKDNSMVYSHTLTLSGLEPDTVYNYVVNSTDAAGNSNESVELTFRTLELSDTTAPVIGTVESYPIIAYAGAVINVSAIVSDNNGVTSVTLNNIAIENLGGDVWAGSFTVPASAAVGSYAVTLKALDAAGNSAQMQVNYSVVIKGGGVSISSSPKPLVVSPGSSGVVNIKLSSTATFDEVVNVTISTTGLSNASAVNLSWFNRTNVIVNVPKGKTVSIPFKVSVPSSTVSGYKAFKDSAKSLGLNSTSMETGSINVKP
ncbi:MAG: carboxypeptidase regulatory-like domain-containing protein [Euryarchaeota archaeon]|nr:carboxypeptidase regulatory-like domain-containing protein [Euryarchaeota archaeon]MCG2737847.1 carboxypeptidase regulatory-like domain-containing protein [Candidatus Methanoperedenaceae archaeon]